MKTLELNQMEILIGGTNYCGAQTVLSSLGFYGAVFFASNPIGWGLAAIAGVSWYLTALECK
ncbi:MAG: hypothetical protein COZ76_12105 [Flavobacteriales bacterium CG_4_8_14_3_um_filter_35_10]|nr:MAG: hypothetical protein COZ76_12105 [Flavobacteriales bacterium CG_4_8_14_3_um_filter_35_10]